MTASRKAIRVATVAIVHVNATRARLSDRKPPHNDGVIIVWLYCGDCLNGLVEWIE